MTTSTNIKILDCTLRDGGYNNEWSFGETTIKNTLQTLIDSNIEYIECGFFKKLEYDPDKSLFPALKYLEKLLPHNNLNSRFMLMINFGKYEIEDIPTCKNKNIGFRIAFKKENLHKAIDFAQDLLNKGYFVSLNPSYTNYYTQAELLELIEQVNRINPQIFTIVDTIGSMNESDTLNLFQFINTRLNSNIALGFHSHNNLQLSFENTKKLIAACNDRELIVDSTILGIGRGAGNLQTEVLMKYLNCKFNSNYNLEPVLKLIKENEGVFKGLISSNTTPYYLSAINDCHPDYAKYLVDKQIVSSEVMNKLLQAIPDDKKRNYDAKLIENIFYNFKL